MNIDVKNKTLVFGIGQGGINALDKLLAKIKKDEFTEYFAMDSDIETLKNSTAEHKITIGYDVTYGKGCHCDTKLGENCVVSSEEILSNLINGAVEVIILTCLGKGIGSGATLQFLRMVKGENLYTTVICTCPQDFEGKSSKVGTDFLGRIEPFIDDYVLVGPENIENTTLQDMYEELEHKMVVACINKLFEI